MNDDLKLYLDGEIDRSELSREFRREAERWDALLSDVRDSGVQGAPVGLESRVMAEVRQERRRLLPSLVDWWVHPRSVRVRPWLGLPAAALLAKFFLLPRENLYTEPAREASALVD